MFSCGCQESTKPGLKRNHHGKKPTKFNLLLAFFTFYIWQKIIIAPTIQCNSMPWWLHSGAVGQRGEAGQNQKQALLYCTLRYSYRGPVRQPRWEEWIGVPGRRGRGARKSRTPPEWSAQPAAGSRMPPGQTLFPPIFLADEWTSVSAWGLWDPSCTAACGWLVAERGGRSAPS
jgi:hypothetical protein